MWCVRWSGREPLYHQWQPWADETDEQATNSLHLGGINSDDSTLGLQARRASLHGEPTANDFTLRQWREGLDLMAGKGYKDYFQVLGVNRGADADAIKKLSASWRASTSWMSIPAIRRLRRGSRKSARPMKFSLIQTSVVI